MTPEAQRIAIAEACGWTQVKQCTCKHHPCGIRPGKTEESGKWAGPHVPDYLRDLNAMHEAEKVLTDEQYHRHGGYIDKLNDVVADGPMERVPTAGGTSVMIPTTTPRWMSPTSAQRAEAFLRTLGKWDDAK